MQRSGSPRPQNILTPTVDTAVGYCLHKSPANQHLTGRAGDAGGTSRNSPVHRCTVSLSMPLRGTRLATRVPESFKDTRKLLPVARILRRGGRSVQAVGALEVVPPFVLDIPEYFRRPKGGVAAE